MKFKYFRYRPDANNIQRLAKSSNTSFKPKQSPEIMYNSDGTVRPRGVQRTAPPKGSLDLSWEDAKENIHVPNGIDSRHSAAGLKSNVTSLGGADLPLKQRPGSAVRHQQNLGSLRFSDDGEVQPAPTHKGVSDAKRRALYESSVFGGSQIPDQQRAHAHSEFKKKEHTGSDIFHHFNLPEEEKRAVLGGIKKAPGGGGSLTMQNLHALTPSK